MIESAQSEVSPSDLRERLARRDHISQEELVELLCCDQVKRWRAGERIPAEAYLSLHPALARLRPRDMIKDGLTAPLHPGAEQVYKELGLIE